MVPVITVRDLERYGLPVQMFKNENVILDTERKIIKYLSYLNDKEKYQFIKLIGLIAYNLTVELIG